MTNSEDSLRRLDIELDAIRENVMHLAGLIKEQFHLALQSLDTGNMPLIRQVRIKHCQTNLLQLEIDRKCAAVLALHQPEAVDLRLILTALKIRTDLEQIGEQTELLLRKTEILIQQGQSHSSTDIARCASLALGMVNRATDAFSRSDASIAAQVIRHNKQIKDEYNFITRSLVDYMLKGPRSISMALDILFVAKAIERVGDHAKNISEYVIYMIKGCDVRHYSIEDVEKKSLQPMLQHSGYIARRLLTESSMEAAD